MGVKNQCFTQVGRGVTVGSRSPKGQHLSLSNSETRGWVEEKGGGNISSFSEEKRHKEFSRFKLPHSEVGCVSLLLSLHFPHIVPGFGRFTCKGRVSLRVQATHDAHLPLEMCPQKALVSFDDSVFLLVVGFFFV